TSVGVELIFSRGCLLLSHVRNILSAQTTYALLCVGLWNQLVSAKDKDIDIGAVANLPEADAEDDSEELDDGRDGIILK
ncbi:hypothetical protein P692DRAFT_20751188, partial [Suillus brevipes Sb2]